MGKRAISLTLDNANLLWLQARARQTQARSMSELVDQMLTNVRAAGSGIDVEPRSVVGLAKIVDPTLLEEDEADDGGDERLRSSASGSRRLVTAVRETSPSYRTSRSKRGRG